MSDAAASLLVGALERGWSGIRRHHRDLPAVVVLVGPGDHGKRRKWGHFAAGRWTQNARSSAAESTVERVHEVLLAGESLERPPVETFGTLLHEAGHALAEARGIKDTSRKGQYHNGKYAKVAKELGLDVAKDPRIGWSLTTVRPETATRYADEIEVLRAAQDATRQARRRWSEMEAAKSRAAAKWACACTPEPRRMSMAAKDAARGPVVCAVCETEFLKEASDDDA